MEVSDKNMEILCGECDANFQEHFEVGPNAMTAHILAEHPSYSPIEAPRYAQSWLESSRERWEQFQSDYADDRKLDRSIHADAFPDK